MTNTNEKVYLTVAHTQLGNKTESDNSTLIANNNSDVKDKLYRLLHNYLYRLNLNVLFETNDKQDNFIEYLMEVFNWDVDDIINHEEVKPVNFDNPNRLFYSIKREFPVNAAYGKEPIVVEVLGSKYIRERIGDSFSGDVNSLNNIKVCYYYKDKNTINDRTQLSLIKTPYNESNINEYLDNLDKEELAEMLYLSQIKLNPHIAHTKAKVNSNIYRYKQILKIE